MPVFLGEIEIASSATVSLQTAYLTILDDMLFATSTAAHELLRALIFDQIPK